MPSIEVSEYDFKRMQKLAVPLVDTPTTLLTKLLDTFENTNTDQEEFSTISNGETDVYSFEAPPPLVHVKLLSGLIGTHTPAKYTWDAMVALCLELMLQRETEINRVGHSIDLNVVRGKKVDEGYKYVPDLGVSYQGVSAQHAASVIGKTARFLGCGAYVDFIWREKEGAHAPGRMAALSYDLS